MLFYTIIFGDFVLFEVRHRHLQHIHLMCCIRHVIDILITPMLVACLFASPPFSPPVNSCRPVAASAAVASLAVAAFACHIPFGSSGPWRLISARKLRLDEVHDFHGNWDSFSPKFGDSKMASFSQSLAEMLLHLVLPSWLTQTLQLQLQTSLRSCHKHNSCPNLFSPE